MSSVVFLTFTNSHGIMPGIAKHGFIDFDFFVTEDILPSDCVHAYIHQKYVRCTNSDGEETEFELEHWGLSRNLASMCKPMGKLLYPFNVSMIVDIHFGEYE